MRRMDTATTVPDMALEVHLFVRKLVQPAGGDLDFDDREKLHVEIKEWIEKIQTWEHCDLVHEIGPLSKYIREVMTHMKNEGGLVFKLQKAEALEVQQFDSLNMGYEKMVEKQRAKFEAKEITQENLAKALETLGEWRVKRQEANKVELNNLRKEIRDLGLTISRSLDALIDAAQSWFGDDLLEAPPKDAIMEELEGLMGNLDTTMEKPTSVLGGVATPPPMLPDAQPESLSPSKAESQQEPVIPAAQPTPPTHAEMEVSGVMTAPTPEDTALKHIAQMEDGPLKSSLLALCEASVSKAPLLPKNPTCYINNIIYHDICLRSRSRYIYIYSHIALFHFNDLTFNLIPMLPLRIHGPSTWIEIAGACIGSRCCRSNHAAIGYHAASGFTSGILVALDCSNHSS